MSGLRRPSDLAGLRVLLVGAGNSGVEIAGQLVDAGVAGLWVSVRTPPSILPRELARVPLQPLGVPLNRVPERLADSVCQLASRLAFGDLARYGLPWPELGPYTRLRLTGVSVAVDEGFVAHLRAGRVTVVPEISRLDGQEVVLADGTRLCPDVVLAATGYRRGLEPLVGHLGVLDEAGRPRGDGGQAARPGLWFTGYRVQVAGSLRLHGIDARRIARRLARG